MNGLKPSGGGTHTLAQIWLLFLLCPWPFPNPPSGGGVLRGRVKSTLKEITLCKFSGYILKSLRGDTTGRCVVLSSQHKIPNSKFNCLLLRGKATVVDISLHIQRLAGVVLINKTQEQPLNVFGS